MRSSNGITARNLFAGRRATATGKLEPSSGSVSFPRDSSATLATITVFGGVAGAAVRYLSAPPGQEGPIVLLVIGSDAGPPRGGDPLTGRADGLHLLVVSEDR
ncbi:MAG: hypothetical protein KY432_11400, partial [Acidobacteria bacterium]|nr:hypothetical protein [Acidobacteriota bacterium]